MGIRHEGVVALLLLLLISGGLEACAVMESNDAQWEWPTN